MKIGLISDIHGSISGLNRALDLLRGQAVDAIVCAGDLIDRGEDDRAVVAKIRAEGIPTVQGNHDQSAHISVQRAIQDAQFMAEMYGMPPPEVETLSEDDVAYLAGLPRTLRFEWAGVRVLMAHGAPWAIDTYITPQALRRVYQRLADEAAAELVILGHTHTPMQVDVGAVRVVNPGSVYQARSMGIERRTCALLDLPARRLTVFDLDTRKPIPIFKNALS